MSQIADFASMSIDQKFNFLLAQVMEQKVEQRRMSEQLNELISGRRETEEPVQPTIHVVPVDRSLEAILNDPFQNSELVPPVPHAEVSLNPVQPSVPESPGIQQEETANRPTAEAEPSVVVSSALRSPSPEQPPPSTATAAAAVSVDYRLHVVSKGNGNDECCQRSVDLIPNRNSPIECILSHIDSPSFFWIQLSTNRTDTITDELNCELDTDAKALSNPNVGDYCAAPVEGDEDLQRAKILEIKDNGLGTSFSKILYIDTGKVDWVATKALLELPRRLRHYLRQACPCVLADLQPSGGVWTDDVIDIFRQLCTADENMQLYAVVLDDGEPPEINTVALYRAKKGESAKQETIFIPLIRSSQGKVRRAERVVPMTEFEKQDGEPMGGLKPPDEIEGWRCTVRALAAEPVDEAADIENDSESRVAAREALRVTIAERAAPITPGQIKQVPLHEFMSADSVYFYVATIHTPSEFYIQTVDSNGRNAALEALTRDMNSFYSNPVNQALVSHMQMNQSAVARTTLNGEVAYRRVIIKDCQTPRNAATLDIRVHSVVTAIFVDFGNCDRMPAKDIFQLDQRFCALPAQAAYCKLFECYSLTVSGAWDQNGIGIFKALVTDGKPLMKAWLCSESQPYELIMYRKESDGEWTCINRKMVESKHARSDMEFP